MTRTTTYAMAILFGSTMTAAVMAGEATTSAYAGNSGRNGGTVAATAHYDGADGGVGLARTQTRSGEVNLARGLALGVDENGLDFSFSHAIATPHGPAYAGTLNLSIGRNGDVSGSYGGVLSQGGAVRNAQAGGTTRTDYRGATAQANATGNTWPGGRVVARTNSYNSQPRVYVPARLSYAPRYGR